jgi:hypothetical protein
MTVDFAVKAGCLAMAKQNWPEARRHFTQVISLDPDHAPALSNLSVALLASDRAAEAVVVARRAVAAQQSAESWHNLGYALAVVGRFAEAETAFVTSLEYGETPHRWHLLGLVLHALGGFADAINAYDRELALLPPDPPGSIMPSPARLEALDKRGLSQLGLGEYREGLIDNKIRWSHTKAHPLMHGTVPEWAGESLIGKTIVVLHEQGFGDTFQLVRYVPRLKELGAKRVILSVPSSLIELMTESAVADEVIGISAEMPAGADYVCPMMTVPVYTGCTLADLQACHWTPYLHVPADYPNLLGPRRGKLRVGLVWGGKPMYADDKWRSMPFKALLPMIEASPHVEFFSLQADERKAELYDSGLDVIVRDLSGVIGDWSDTAALIANELDVVVSVDTAVAHLAGALGKPVKIMLSMASCWRWLKHDSTESPWYPSAHLIRQTKQGDWTGPVGTLTAYLHFMSPKAECGAGRQAGCECGQCIDDLPPRTQRMRRRVEELRSKEVA